ncbi:MAG: hypothetical protein ACP5MX_02475 [Candidatus Micrarchaeia archaeon]
MDKVNEIIGSILKKYNIPVWVTPYVLKYAKGNPMRTIKFAMSFIETKRKKGAVANGNVILPNGLQLKVSSLIRILNIVFYEQDLMSKVAKKWAMQPAGHDSVYAKYAMELAEAEERHAIAIKNLIEGLGYKIGEPDKQLEALFDYICNLDSWQKRLIAVNIVLRDSYAKAFGVILYKVFYSVSPEYMRAFGKAFKGDEKYAERGYNEAVSVIVNRELSDEEIIGLTRDILVRVLRTIDINMSIAKEAGIEEEVKFLRDIAILYPFQMLKELGVAINPDKELEEVKKQVSKSNV